MEAVRLQKRVPKSEDPHGNLILEVYIERKRYTHVYMIYVYIYYTNAYIYIYIYLGCLRRELILVFISGG